MLGRHLHVDIRLLSQLSERLHDGMQIFMKALPPHQLSSLPAYMAPHAALPWTHVEARRSGNSRKGMPAAH